jgi:hypothetical protein
VSYSDIQGSWTGAGTGNLNVDPLFVDPAGGDCHLSPGSPCIDGGDNTSVTPDAFDVDGDGDVAEPLPLDLDAYARFVDDPDTADTGQGTPPLVDMGACEFQGSLLGDLDADLDVDGDDFAIFADCMSGPDVDCASECELADLEGDSDVDLVDFQTFQQRFTGPQP